MSEPLCDPQAGDFYRRVLEALNAAGAEYLIGGAYAIEYYTSIARHTKDVDIFTRPADRDRILRILGDAGYRTDVTSPVWLAKAHYGEDFADVIFSSGNGIAEVDDGWFLHARHGRVLGVPVRLCPPEEMIWSKAFLMERERYDGADVLHLVRACGETFDWRRLLDRFAQHWPVLLSHLVLFAYVYPSERGGIPAWVMRELIDRLGNDLARPDGERVCFGTLLSKKQFRPDVDRWGYGDGRVAPQGRLSAEQVSALDREA
jgi:hypothetical protein